MCLCLGGVSRCLPLSLPRVCLCWIPEVLSPRASHCLPWSPRMCACVGWCVPLPKVSPCLPLSPIVSHCLRACVPVLEGVFAFPGSCLPFAPVLDGVSAFPGSCLPLSPHICVPVLDGVFAFPTHMCACVGWCLRLPEVLSPLVSLLVPLVSHCLFLFPFVGWCVFPRPCPPCLPASLQACQVVFLLVSL